MALLQVTEKLPGSANILFTRLDREDLVIIWLKRPDFIAFGSTAGGRDASLVSTAVTGIFHRFIISDTLELNIQITESKLSGLMNPSLGIQICYHLSFIVVN